MATLLFLMLVSYAAGLLLPLCVPDRPKIQNLIAHSLAAFAGMEGISLGIIGLVAPHPLTISIPSTLPLLSFDVRLDPL